MCSDGTTPMADKSNIIAGQKVKSRMQAKDCTTSEQLRLNVDICKVGDSGGVPALLHLVESRHTEMNLLTLSTALHRLTRLCTEESYVVGDEANAVIRLLHECIRKELEVLHESPGSKPQARCLSTIAWSHGKLQENNLDVMWLVSELSERWIASFRSFELANLLWSFAKLNLGHFGIFRKAQVHVEERLADFTTRDLSLVAWSLATAMPSSCGGCLAKIATAFATNLNLRDEEPVSLALAFATNLSLRDEKPVSLANMAWALASAGARPPQEALLMIGDACAHLLGAFKANELSITLWAFARLGCFHDMLFDVAAGRLCSEEALQAEIHAQGIANTMWAMARYAEMSEINRGGVGSLPADVLRCLQPTYYRLLPDLRPIEFCALLRSVSKLAVRTGLLHIADSLLVVAAARDPAFLQQLAPNSSLELLRTVQEHVERMPSAPKSSYDLEQQLQQQVLHASIACDASASASSFSVALDFAAFEASTSLHEPHPFSL